MPCGVLTSPITKHLATNFSGADSLRFEAFTEWFPAMGMDYVKAILKLKSLTQQFQCQLAVQTAAVRTSAPDSWTTLDQMTSSDRCTTMVDVTSTLTGKMYVRFGIAYNCSSGTTNSQADVTLQLSFDACGSIVGSVTLQALAPDTSSYFVAVTGWIPAIDAAKVRAAILASGAINNFECRLTYRTAQITPEMITDHWATATLEGSYHSGSGEWNTGEITLPTGAVSGRIDDKMWIQFGLQFKVSSGTAGQATVSVVTAVRS